MKRQDGNGRGDDVYQPDEGGDREVSEDTGVLDPEDTLVDRGVPDVLDEGYSPPERPLAVEDVGTTDDEQHTGESLDTRLARERPEPRPPLGDGLGDSSDTDGELLDPEAGDLRSGRLLAPDEGSHSRAEGLTGEDVGIDGGAASAEEAAVHVVADPEEASDDDGDAGR
jgi:Family of unknown function (DUF5709)